MSDWIPLHCHSHFSRGSKDKLLDALSRPEQIAHRAVECGFPAVALTDHGSISGSAAFIKALKDACNCGHQKKSHSSTRCMKPGCRCQGFTAASVRPLLGSEFFICRRDAAVQNEGNLDLAHVCVLAKGQEGWRNLVRASSASNRPEFYYKKPRLDLDRLASFAGGKFVVFSGHVGSDMANVLFADWRKAYSAMTYEDARGMVRDDWREASVALACRYRDLFGKENFFLEVQRIDGKNMPAAEVVSRTIRWVGKKTGIPCVATADSHYPRREDSSDHQVLLCAALETTLNEVQRKQQAGEDVGLGGFFRSKNYYIPTADEMAALHEPAELSATIRVAEMCGTYDILGKPMLPEFPCPGGVAPDDFLRKLCEEGWVKKLSARTRADEIWGERANSFGGPGSDPVSFPVSEYRERVERELGVIKEAGLASYFLIVQDYCAYARQRGKVGKGRGCLLGQTPVRLANGLTKPLRDVVVGDRLLTRDGRPRSVLETMAYDVDEEVVIISAWHGESGGVGMTLEHKVFAEKAKRPAGYENWGPRTRSSRKAWEEPVGVGEWIAAGDLDVGDWVFVPRQMFEVTMPVYDLGVICGKEPAIRHDDHFVYHEQRNPLTGTLVFSRPIKKTLVVDEDLAFLFGSWVGNGWLKSCEGGRGVVGFCCHGQNKVHEAAIRRILEKIGVPYSVKLSKDDKLCQINARHRVLATLFRTLHPNYAYRAQTKHIPQDVFGWPDFLKYAYLRGYVATDGHIDKAKVVITTVSRTLADGTRSLAGSLNIPSSLREEIRLDGRPGWPAESRSFYITLPLMREYCGRDASKKTHCLLTQDGAWVQVREITRCVHQGKVYDVHVEKESNYCTSSFLVHNSCAGSLVSYLSDISDVDPMVYGLLFERFYNAGRNAPGRVALPDIDSDFEKHKRGDVKAYIRQKYGANRVADMATFARMQGRGAIKDVLRAHGKISFEEMNRITEWVPDEAAIADHLQDMLEETGEASILRWALENEAEGLKNWVSLRDDGELEGPLAMEFAQAMRLEGTLRSQGKHASGLIISAVDLPDVVPMCFDKKSGEMIVAVDHRDAESIGLVKFDLLGVAVLSRIRSATELIRTGRLPN